MGVPKRKTSKSRKRKRHSNKSYSLPKTVSCPHCNQPTLPHRICPNCGFYKGEAVAEAAKG